ncbi:MAG: hypothetical protein HQ485_10620 [Acidobacteria bacterium]|nr:hypothetical protein [Acidobacteriota bacterium]
MAEHFEETMAARVDELASSVDVRFDAVDARFDAVDARLDSLTIEVRDHFVEMRDFTTFGFDKLGKELRAEISDVKMGLGRVERRLDRHEDLLGQVLTEVRALRRE